MSADNQQERLKVEGWILGFVDGEGCFAISIYKNGTTRNGWQIFHEFVVTQGEKSIESLEILRNFFKCGNIYVNHRNDNHKENLYRYCVRSLKDLQEKIIPFFERNRLKTSKSADFEKFASVIRMIADKSHYSDEGLRSIAKILQTMNRKVPSKFLASSETIRQKLNTTKI